MIGSLLANINPSPLQCMHMQRNNVHYLLFCLLGSWLTTHTPSSLTPVCVCRSVPVSQAYKDVNRHVYASPLHF